MSSRITTQTSSSKANQSRQHRHEFRIAARNAVWQPPIPTPDLSAENRARSLSLRKPTGAVN
jgi:hypothetical protein